MEIVKFRCHYCGAFIPMGDTLHKYGSTGLEHQWKITIGNADLEIIWIQEVIEAMSALALQMFKNKSRGLRK